MLTGAYRSQNSGLEARKPVAKECLLEGIEDLVSGGGREDKTRDARWFDWTLDHPPPLDGRSLSSVR